MFASVPSATLVGVDARPVRVEAHVARGLPSITVVGLPDAAVREARERVRAAMASTGFSVPRSRVLINLAPADLRKEGPSLDLPIALALLAADGRVPREAAASVLCSAELALDGTLRPVRGAIAVGLLAAELGLPRMLVADDDAPGVAALGLVETWPADDLAEAVALLRGTSRPRVLPPRPREPEPAQPDLADVRGRAMARFALELAAAGGHGLLLTGPPGSGKTMLARRLPGLLPELSRDEAVEVTRIHSSAGRSVRGGLLRRPPFRAPHHRITHVGLVGGGRSPRPGEISLAHRGVLFLDELPEFGRSTLEALRQPLEEGRIAVDRHRSRTVFPAAFQLVAARNPCPCGWFGTEPPRCACHPADRRRYAARVSGPILDRIDLHVHLAPMPAADLVGAPRGESSADVARRVRTARAVAHARQGTTNARLAPDLLAPDLLAPNLLAPNLLAPNLVAPGRGDHGVALDGATRGVARATVHDLGLTARGFARLLRVARSVADLEGSEAVTAEHVRSAAQFRHPDGAGTP